MKLREREMPLDPEVERELEAIDRALGDEPVDPDLEVLAELARALREERVGAEPGFAARLDQRVADGFPRPGRLADSDVTVWYHQLRSVDDLRGSRFDG